MMKFLEQLAARRRFGMKPGLETITAICAALGDPQKAFKAIHVAGTNGKGAVCAILDACLREAGFKVGRYTSPHLVKLNERFVLNGAPVDDATLERAAADVDLGLQHGRGRTPACPPDGVDGEVTFFEALTAVAFLLCAEAKVDFAVLETGLGGRLDATNVCVPVLTVITRIGLDHCDWLGDTVEKIAAEKAGIVKPGVPIVLGANCDDVRTVVARRAKEVGAPFFYAPEIASEGDIPEGFALAGAFNRENAVTAIAAIRVLLGRLGRLDGLDRLERRDRLARLEGLADPRALVWPGRFQRVGRFIVDGAHNPPAARALVASLASSSIRSVTLIAGFCGDKDVDEVLRLLAPRVSKGCAVAIRNPRTLSAEATAAKMRAAGIDAEPCASLRAALVRVDPSLADAEAPSAARPPPSATPPSALVAGSLFLAGEALVELGAYPWATDRVDPSEALVREGPLICPAGEDMVDCRHMEGTWFRFGEGRTLA